MHGSRRKNPARTPKTPARILANNRAYAKRRRDADPNWRRDHYLRPIYGIGQADYDYMLALQGGRCALCKSAVMEKRCGGRLHVDHCHETGTVRGLLCFKCNSAIGWLGDTPVALARVLSYLEGDW